MTFLLSPTPGETLTISVRAQQSPECIHNSMVADYAFNISKKRKLLIVTREFLNIEVLPRLTLLQSNRQKSLRDVAMVAKLLDLNKLWSCQYGKRKNDMYDFLMHYCTQGQKRCRGRKTPHFSLPHFLLRLGYRHESKIAVPMQLKWLHSLFSYSSRHRRVFLSLIHI